MKKNDLFAFLASILFSTGAAFLYADSAVAQGGSSVQDQKVMKKEDRALAKNVLKALAKVKDLDSDGIIVTARAGAITLSGTIADAAQRTKAVEVAQGVPGVTKVTEYMRIKPIYR